MLQDNRTRFNRRAVKVKEAQQRVLAAVQPLAIERAALWQCGGRRIAEALTATSDWPPFARSGLDGFAIRGADAAQASPQEPVTLRIVDAIAAGQVARARVEAGTAVRIMTGAAVPEGADAVVMLEQTADAVLAGQPAVLVKHAVQPGQNVALPGEEFRRGSVLVQPGALIRPGHVAMLGTFGYAELPVYARPRVAIMATGTELLPVEAALAPGQIRDSNSAMVAAMVAQSGGEPLLLGRLPDRLDAVQGAMAEALAAADCIVTTGGVSVGDFDIMAAYLAGLPEQAGYEKLFDKVAMRPGSPTSAALVDHKPLFALSGNPGACFVGFELFVHPALRRMQGADEPLSRIVQAQLAADVPKPSPHERYVRGSLLMQDGRLYAEPLRFGKSSMMASIPSADILIIVPPGSEGAAAGQSIEALLLEP